MINVTILEIIIIIYHISTIDILPNKNIIPTKKKKKSLVELPIIFFSNKCEREAVDYFKYKRGISNIYIYN